MFLSAGVRLHVVAGAFRRMTMLMLVHSGACVTLVPGSFANGAMDGIVTRPLEAGEHRMRVAAAYPSGDLQGVVARFLRIASRSEEHTSELQSLMRISYAVFCLKKKKHNNKDT